MGVGGWGMGVGGWGLVVGVGGWWLGDGGGCSEFTSCLSNVRNLQTN
jgi:hypothetical protein